MTTSRLRQIVGIVSVSLVALAFGAVGGPVASAADPANVSLSLTSASYDCEAQAGTYTLTVSYVPSDDVSAVHLDALLIGHEVLPNEGANTTFTPGTLTATSPSATGAVTLDFGVAPQIGVDYTVEMADGGSITGSAMLDSPLPPDPDACVAGAPTTTSVAAPTTSVAASPTSVTRHAPTVASAAAPVSGRPAYTG